MKRITALLLAAIFLASCAPKPYTAANMHQLVAKQKLVAILPPSVSVELRPHQMKKISSEQLQTMEEKTAGSIQDEIYSWILRKQDRMKYTVAFQDITITNAKIKNAGLSYSELKGMDVQKLAKILSVDAVISMNVITDKPMSDGAALALYAIFGAFGSTNHAKATTSIRDGASGELLWRYSLNASGSVGSSPGQLADMIMRRSARRFPYRSR